MIISLLAPGAEHDGRTVPEDEFWLLADGQLVGRYTPEQVRLHEGGGFDLLGPPEAGLRKLQYDTEDGLVERKDRHG